ncbi:histone-like nucleoid-structuring protein Lsr2 [Saccharopolyspora spinosa]|uniref:histone-like nucleoid-structuring protein Lsr2 n=1 Tax=Saccharopolyspora spinosa TaxID=60894 RepID=UPI0002E85DEA|nr:Lsr2 family protein [Saccharopolyspora spinosa]
MVEFVDDIDGSPAEQTMTFSVEGVVYEIDLNAHHAQHLRDLLQRYITHARREPAHRGNRRAEREQRQARETNKGLTAQIRQAAQRTREHLSHQPASEQTDHTDPNPPAEITEITVVEPHTRKEPRNPQHAPELAPPQFSSI